MIPTLLVAVIAAATKEAAHEISTTYEVDQRVSEVVDVYSDVFGAQDLPLLHSSSFRREAINGVIKPAGLTGMKGNRLKYM